MLLPRTSPRATIDSGGLAGDDMKDGSWSWKVSDNEIVIATIEGGYVLKLNEQQISVYKSAEAALREAVNGNHEPLSSGLTTASLSPSNRLTDWSFTPAAP